MRQKLIAAAAALTLGSFAVVGAFASQDGVGLRGFLSGGVLGAEVAPLAGETATATATETATAIATETGTPEATETGTPEATETSTPAATSTPDPSATPDDDCHKHHDDDADENEGEDSDDDSDEEHGPPVSSPTAADPANASCDDDDDDVHGIPDDNPVHHPEDGDGECEKHETDVRENPNGQQVNVPCQANHDGEHGQGHGHDDNNEEHD
ncbi:MAG: hypothetical protein HY874_04355 [Chloroflexi bacterium]|nr:hypothetical protein [Chloroflexota bacterium]